MPDAATSDAARDRGKLPPLVAAMLEPDFYPDRPDRIELKQTHISYAILAGEYVYKIKKPVRFPFLDASHLDRRLEFCNEEVRLNRKLAPDVYLGVVAIERVGDGFAIAGEGPANGSRATVEYAVKMRRLDDDRRLENLVVKGAAEVATLREIARILADFHSHASTERAWRYASAAAVWRRVLGDLRDYESFIGLTVSPSEIRDIENFCRAFIASRWRLINERVHSGRARECHSDLRAEHIYVNSAIRIIDCVEFSEPIRYGDVASDVAFLAMDLDHIGAPHLAQEFVSAYTQFADDDQVASMMPLHKCHRASIRGMVESRRALAPEVSREDRRRALELARGYFQLAHSYAALGARAAIVVCGMSGTGKSTVARAIRHRLGFEIINSDVVRKRIAGLSTTTRHDGGYAEGIYTSEFNERTYRAMLDEARALLEENRGVILDATFRDCAERAHVVELVSLAGAPILFVECRCPQDVALERIRARTNEGADVSDATTQVYMRQRAEFIALNEIADANRMTVDTRSDPIEVALAVEERMKQTLSQRVETKSGAR
ncbi:MAG TPA: AAA family ATPase [Candidatus Binataceae bacterium]|nr:AAA family ATPase [Candidatus Binataceae bacterium]